VSELATDDDIIWRPFGYGTREKRAQMFRQFTIPLLILIIFAAINAVELPVEWVIK
jgi:hypothetical protein